MFEETPLESDHKPRPGWCLVMRRVAMVEVRAKAPFRPSVGSTDVLLRELVAHLRENRTQLREEWARRITEAKLLTAMTPGEVFAEATAVYDNYLEALETGSIEALEAYARNLSERIIPRGGGNARGRRDRVAAARRARALAVRQVSGRLHGAQSRPGRL